MFVAHLSNSIKNYWFSVPEIYISDKQTNKAMHQKAIKKTRIHAVMWSSAYQILPVARQTHKPTRNAWLLDFVHYLVFWKAEIKKNLLYFHLQVKRWGSIYWLGSNRNWTYIQFQLTGYSWNIKQRTKPSNQVIYRCHNSLELISPVI